ncbi:hypothetical protein ACKWTF_000752 [Chironomus riparius]
MRAFCTVSAPLEVCAPPSRPPLPPLPANARFLALRLFGTPQSRTLYFLVEAKSRVREVYAQTCHHFSKQGMLDTELFGLAVMMDGEYLFADPESKLSKYGPKSWRSSHTHGLDANGKPLLEFHFRVQFYIESPLMLRDEITRHHYYLQLKTNAVHRDVPKECSDQSLLLLGGLSLQADFGDCPDDSQSQTDYFRPDDYIPTALRTTWGISALHSCHRENRGMSRADAETHFIREACGLHEAINAHTFRMKSNKNENGVGSVMLIIYAKGIKIVNETTQPITFLWPLISKLSFDRKKFELRSGDNKITLYSGNDDKNKMLLALCRETHQFSMKIAPRLTEAIKREEEESNCIHACYLYSRALNMQYKSKNDQRISVISSTSSNTTSGIVSDRVHSEDELEILINTPPIAAPSTESLALAHLLDCPSVSRQTSSVGQVSLKDIGDTFAALSVRSNTRSTSSEGTETLKERNSEKDSDVSPTSHNVGSQCSSTCSTIVVVASDSLSLSPHGKAQHNSSSSNGSGRRQSSCSSLELGFSHTAQNSTVSELTTNSVNDNHHFDGTDEQNDDDETISGVYTLDDHVAPTETSGVYTMNSSELTGQSSEIAESESHESSHYGSFHPNSEMGDKLVVNINIDSVDGDFRQRLDSEESQFRMRSDSNISAAGSFRGDGSDPTDSIHNPLTAEELTDLIVGRGSYPSRKTVSNTMDSDCDYVTLPIPLEGESYLQGSEDTAPTEDEYEKDLLEVKPPAPPQRIDSMSLSNLVELPKPPPYNAHHEKTGLRGPDISPEIPSLPIRESQVYPRKSLRSLSTVIPPSTIPEETPARFITTRPHINILKAHTSLVGESTKPSYAAPTVNTINNLSQSPLPTTSSATSLSLGIPIVPYHNLHAKSHLSHSSRYPEAKSAPRTCVLLPVIKPRSQQYVPPPSMPTMQRQPPPPPPQLATVYTSQLARSQIELYQQQLYSDVDYVIYPLQDPAVSQQEYLDSKQGSILAAMAQTQPPPYLAYHTVRAHNRSWDGNHALYRSTPFLSMAISSPSRYASTQNLSDTYVQLPGAYSPLYSPSVASLCSSYDAHTMPPPPLPPLRPPRIAPTTTVTSSSIFSRSRSDDNILNSIDVTPKSRRPIPIPPAYDKKPIRKPPMPVPFECTELPPSVPAKPSTLRSSSTSSILKSQSKSSMNLTTVETSSKMALTLADVSKTTSSSSKPIDLKDLKLSHVICPESNKILCTPATLAQQQIDINILREKSKHLDLPLISALCNDRSLLKQTKAFVMPKPSRSSLQGLSHTSSKSKYPVSGLNTTQLTSTKGRKTTISHRHPNDKLPPLPVQEKSGNKNNYVMDPIPLKQKTNQQNTNL